MAPCHDRFPALYGVISPGAPFLGAVWYAWMPGPEGHCGLSKTGSYCVCLDESRSSEEDVGNYCTGMRNTLCKLSIYLITLYNPSS